MDEVGDTWTDADDKLTDHLLDQIEGYGWHVFAAQWEIGEQPRGRATIYCGEEPNDRIYDGEGETMGVAMERALLKARNGEGRGQ